MPKLPAQHAPILFAVLMSLVMASIMTGFITLINTGFDSGFPLRWMWAFLMAWPLAGVCMLIFRKPVGRIVALLISP